MKDEIIINQLVEYIKEERYNQAVMIDGDWGSGKTYFVKEKLLKELENEIPEKKIYYISLYGASSPDEVINEIYTAMFGEIIARKLGEKKSIALQKGISFTSKLIATGMKYFNIDTNDLPDLSDIKDVKESIIVFDDLERCEIEINKVLGMINNLVEHNDVRIILVANQKEIGRMSFSRELSSKFQVALNEKIILDEKNSDKQQDNKGYTREQLFKRTEQLFAEDILYKKVKEKLIGLTIRYESNLQDIFVSVVKKYIKDDKVERYLLDKKQMIVNLFESKRHYNIRTLIFSLIAFEKIYKIVDEITFEPKVYIENEIERVLKYIIISSIHIKSGKTPYSWQNCSSKSGIIYYDRNNIVDSAVYGYKFVDEYLLQCKLDIQEISNVITNDANEEKSSNESKELENSLQYKKLYSWWELEDEEIEEILLIILEELEQLKYSPMYFKEMIVTLMQLDHHGFECIDYNKYVELMIRKLEKYEGTLRRDNFEVLSDNGEFIEKYNNIAKKLLEFIDNKEQGEKKEDNGFLVKRQCWDEKFQMECINRKDRYISDNKFFYYIEPTKFIEQLQEAKVCEINHFVLGLKSVYSFSNLNEFFKADITNLKEIINQIDIEKMSDSKKTRKIALKKLIDELNEALKSIEESVY